MEGSKMVHSSESPEATTSRSPNRRERLMMEDDAQLYCPKARALIVASDWLGATQLLLRRCRELDMALQSLTPGGSEYVGNPERCVERARENLANYRELWKEAVAKTARQSGDREFEEPSDPVRMNQPSLSKEKEALSQNGEG